MLHGGSCQAGLRGWRSVEVWGQESYISYNIIYDFVVLLVIIPVEPQVVPGSSPGEIISLFVQDHNFTAFIGNAIHSDILVTPLIGLAVKSVDSSWPLRNAPAQTSYLFPRNCHPWPINVIRPPETWLTGHSSFHVGWDRDLWGDSGENPRHRSARIRRNMSGIHTGTRPSKRWPKTGGIFCMGG